MSLLSRLAMLHPDSQPYSFCWGFRVQPTHTDFRNRLRADGPTGTRNPTFLCRDCLEWHGVEGEPGILTDLTNELITKGWCESLELRGLANTDKQIGFQCAVPNHWLPAGTYTQCQPEHEGVCLFAKVKTDPCS